MRTQEYVKQINDLVRELTAACENDASKLDIVHEALAQIRNEAAAQRDFVIEGIA